VLSIPAGTVGSRRHRALTVLRRKMELETSTREISARRRV
jgi:DNA-directed RNA polymerase specialized sigma24 family protein